jgi:HAD superfamily hydrolase (TIGR01509 family)
MYDQTLLQPQDRIMSALRQLREMDVKLGLLSNIDEREAVCWSTSPLSSLFDVVCMSFDIGYSKPSREAYSVVLSKLGTDASSSIYVGDGSHDELRGAREAGFGLVVFMKGFISRNDTRSAEIVKIRERQADVTISDLNEVVALLDELQVEP